MDLSPANPIGLKAMGKWQYKLLLNSSATPTYFIFHGGIFFAVRRHCPLTSIYRTNIDLGDGLTSLSFLFPPWWKNIR